MLRRTLTANDNGRVAAWRIWAIGATGLWPPA
jgi:hypothetical protein